MPTASEIIREKYNSIIKNKYPELCAAWPIVSGYNLINGTYGNYIICIFKHTGNNGMMASSVVEFTPTNTGVSILVYIKCSDNNLITKILKTEKNILENMEF